MKNKLFFVIMLTLPSLYYSMFRILNYDHLSNLRLQTSSIMNQISKSNTPIKNNHYLQAESLTEEMEIFNDFVEKTLLNMKDNKEKKYTEDYLLNNNLQVKNSNKSQKYNVMVIATTISPQNHKNEPKHELQNTKHNDSQTDNLNKLFDTIKRRITDITKIKNKTSTNSPTEEKPKVKLNHQCFHQGELCAYCNSNYCNFNEESDKHWCSKYCKHCQCC